MTAKTYIETYKIWDIFFSEERERFYAYDSLSSDCCASNMFLSELKIALDKEFDAL